MADEKGKTDASEKVEEQEAVQTAATAEEPAAEVPASEKTAAPAQGPAGEAAERDGRAKGDAAPRERKPRRQLGFAPSMVASGAVFAVLGVLCFAWPDLALETEAFVLGIGFLVGAVAVFADFFTNLRGYTPWLAVSGGVDLVLGLVLALKPLVGAQVVAWVIALAIVLAGVAQLVSCWGGRSKVDLSWWLSLVSGVVNIALGVCLVIDPSTTTVWLPVFTLVYGVCAMALSFKVVRPRP